MQRERNRQEKAEATETPARIHQSQKKSLTFLERQLSELQKEIDEHIDHHPDLKEDRALFRAILYMAAVVAIRHNPHIKALYARLLAKGKSRMSAIGTAMRKLVHLCFGVLKTRSPYQANYVKNT
ncbi:hypothetical protein FACS1894154_06350 [Betaproteobacteria bacterium]|nr:hypothetical protein FACS1894154_06350 [Betaproteobacteria bacterium]